ncbi:hypothetical protein GCM10028799_14050 [Kribbella italica]
MAVVVRSLARERGRTQGPVVQGAPVLVRTVLAVRGTRAVERRVR